ncbi:MAG: redoxin domain-containing protein [Gemmataceae bacterium]|nr:redoxin domain-containing protein [Gemmataceae bacterium]
MPTRTLTRFCLCLATALALVIASTQGPAVAQEQKPQPKKKGARPGEVITPAAKSERIKNNLKANDPAPDFTLSDPKGTRTVKLSDFRGKRPVVLIFGSYT